MAASSPCAMPPRPRTRILWLALAQKAAEGGATFYYETPCVQLVQEEDGTVTGAIGKQKDGSYVKLNATKGVVLAAGDYMNNESMVDRNLRDAAMFPLCLVNHTGDGHILGILAGGRMAPLGHARQIHTNYIGPFMFYPFLALDVHGKRFCNETIPMSSLNISMSATYKPEDRGIHFRIFDSKTEGAVEGIPGVPPVALVGEGSAWMDPETVVSGNTLEELCEAAGIPVARTASPASSATTSCAPRAADDDFGVAGSDMAAIDTPPFFCIKGDVGISGINAGIMVDNRYRVTDGEGDPIPGPLRRRHPGGQPLRGHQLEHAGRLLERAHLHRRTLHRHPRANRGHDALEPGELRVLSPTPSSGKTAATPGTAPLAPRPSRSGKSTTFRPSPCDRAPQRARSPLSAASFTMSMSS